MCEREDPDASRLFGDEAGATFDESRIDPAGTSFGNQEFNEQQEDHRRRTQFNWSSCGRGGGYHFANVNMNRGSGYLPPP